MVEENHVDSLSPQQAYEFVGQSGAQLWCVVAAIDQHGQIVVAQRADDAIGARAE